ncbi:methyl-accepting chemotaxis protein [Thiomicrorhabdus indica]|uniref:methyl-accepting chemotaxis protein n=1 Tax=Thiomicrorhabdus indica TaxID=2267253 RepID=UPI002AA805BC|nr:methyl-accepting chemotaxis protein [Thiomicrorhabdus indica]
MESTHQEFDISKFGTIVSKTDLHGTITGVNEAFIHASGYSKEELIGQPQSIVRHPDVPKAVFKDLWSTLKSDKPWVQIVKNRRKDGRYYWVQANITPMYENGKIIGYLSVRTAIDNATKNQAENLYQQIKSGKKRLDNGYPLSSLQKLCIFDKIHPINLMLTMIGLMGILATSIQSGLIQLPTELVIFISAFFFFYTWAGKKYAFNRLGSAKKVIDKMREGDFSGQVNFRGNHSLGKLVSAVKMMQVQLGAMYDDSQTKLNSSMRLKSALDSASSNIMMVNQSGKVIYLNHQMEEFFQKNHTKIQSAFENFSVETLIGQNLSTVCHSEFFSDLSQAKTSQETICDLNIELSIIPVQDDEGTRLGSVLEWKDMTQQRVIERELESTLKMASIGHTDLHIDTRNLSGFYLDTSNNVNSLLSELHAIIENMVHVMTKLAIGDVRGRIDKDLQGSLAAMKGATNVSLDNLSSIIMYIKKAAGTVQIAADESYEAANDLSDRTQQAAAAIEQVNSAMQNMSHLQMENTRELTNVNDSALQTMQENKKAKSSLKATVDSIQEIQKTSEQISNIISIIDGIAFQTNLLALNAAVEAARAGEHGRGFAVVAGEVRTLAQKSAGAAQDIKVLINDSVLKVNQGVEKVQETNEAFEIVDQRVNNISNAMKTVLGSIEQQQNTVSEIAQALNELDTNIQNNASLVDQSSAASHSLKEQAVLLNTETAKFLIDEHKAIDLIQDSPELFGVKMADVRQNMRVWRTSIQTYLNGIPIDMDANQAVNPESCFVGKSLATLLNQFPQMQQMNEYQKVRQLHVRQHELVKSAMEILNQADQHSLEDLKTKDAILDQFVNITDDLDKALAALNSALTSELMQQATPNSQSIPQLRSA